MRSLTRASKLTLAAWIYLTLLAAPAAAAGDAFPSSSEPQSTSPAPDLAPATKPDPLSSPGPNAPTAATKPSLPAPATPPPDRKEDPGKASQKKQRQRSELEFRNFVAGYQAARDLVLDGKYDEAIAAFKALGHDESAEVANYLGYAYRKLGDYDLAKVWYDRALVADPNHVRTWQYYGLWHLEQGNKLKAEDFLERIRALCGGTSCQEYIDLNEAIAHGLHSY